MLAAMPTSLRHHVVEHLGRRIASGTLPSGHVMLAELRTAVEPAAAELAAANAPAELRSELVDIAHAMRDAGVAGDVPRFLDLDIRFHSLLLTGSGNEMFANTGPRPGRRPPKSCVKPSRKWSPAGRTSPGSLSRCTTPRRETAPAPRRQRRGVFHPRPSTVYFLQAFHRGIPQ